MYTADREYVMNKYNLKALREVENLVAEAVQIQVPSTTLSPLLRFHHKAGIHAKAILATLPHTRSSAPRTSV